jgi:hypothetical protein
VLQVTIPGSRIEAIGKALGYKTKELALPMKKLIAESTVKTEGEQRATTYAPVAGKRKKAAYVATHGDPVDS